MHKKEILRLIQKVSEKGYALIPLSFYYSKTGKIKVELALAKGKHSFDKRDTLRNKQIQNDIKRCLKQV